MPKREKDDGLDGEELEYGVVLGEKLPRGGVEENQAVEGDGDGEVVGQGTVEVAVCWTSACVYIVMLMTEFHIG